jgi:hypothetical protein
MQPFGDGGEQMSKLQFRVALALVAASTLLAIAAPCGAQQVLFTNRSLRGSYALDLTGSYRAGSTLLTLVGTGVLTSTGDKNLSATVTTMDGSFVCTETLSGSYSVAASGSGSGSFTISSSTPVNGVCDKLTNQEISFAFVLIGRRPANRIKLSLTNSTITLLGIGDAQ